MYDAVELYVHACSHYLYIQLISYINVTYIYCGKVCNIGDDIIITLVRRIIVANLVLIHDSN